MSATKMSATKIIAVISLWVLGVSFVHAQSPAAQPAPVLASQAPQPAQSEAQQPDPDRININTADARRLQDITGVGPKTAEAIISWRQRQGGFTSVDQLLAIRGIGEKTLAKMRSQVTVR